MIGLRSVGRAGALLDASHRFPDLEDAQLVTACQTVRFIDHQNYFTPEQTHLLLRALARNDAQARQLFHQQLHLSHRRDSTQLQLTPLWSVLTLPSELELICRECIALFLQLALLTDGLGEKAFFESIDKNSDMVLQADELFVALGRMGIRPTTDDLWAWLQAADAQDAGEMSFEKFLQLARRARPPFPPAAEGGFDWEPPVRLALVTVHLAVQRTHAG